MRSARQQPVRVGWVGSAPVIVSRTVCWWVLFLLGSSRGSSALAQTLMDFGDPRFPHAVACRRMEVLEAQRLDASLRFLAVAEEIASDPRGSRGRRTELLGEAQRLADSIAFLDEQLVEADSAVAAATCDLIMVLEGQCEAARRAAGEADPEGRPALEVQARALQAEIDALRTPERRGMGVHPLRAGASTLSALERVVAGERARLHRLERIRDELRIFLGYLRVFDETGMPPSVRAETGGAAEPGCDPSSCPTGFSASPADMPLEHVRPEGGGTGEGGSAAGVTVASLDRLLERLAVHSGRSGSASPEEGEAVGGVTRETGVSVGFLGFRRQGEGRSGLSLKVGTSFLFTRVLGPSTQLTVEPWLGTRSVHLDPGSSAEMGAEVRETLTGAIGAGAFRWQVTSWQKGRFLSDPLPLPAYLEPGRREGGVATRVAVALRSPWTLEVGGGGDWVRYGPEDWKALSRHGVNASVALARYGASHSARLSLLASRHAFALEADPRREDTRLGAGGDWSHEGRVVVRLSAGATWNDSRLPAYDYRSGRAALVLSAPWGKGSLQAYGALARQNYLNPGSEDRRVAPSDQDTGSILALQFTRPLGATRTLAFRAEWSRSETGFGNDFYQRFGTSVQVAFRGLGSD